MQLQMTPMIDVVFQLLIFFVCTTSFQALEQILPTTLSSAGGVGEAVETPPELVELEDVIIKLGRQPTSTTWQLNEQAIDSLPKLRERLMRLVRLRSDLPVILDVASDVPLGDVIDVYDLCRVVGFDKVQFAAKADATPSPRGTP